MRNSIINKSNIRDDCFITEETIDGKKTYMMFIETFDGLYTTVGLRLPDFPGPYPLVLLASGNGGEGLGWIRENIKNNSYTLERMIDEGFACAWIRYRTEVELGYNDGGKLIRDKRQGREMFNRSPLEYEDEIAIIEILKSFTEIDADKIGLIGMSHGGEMVMKITSEYHGVAAAVASEPAAHEFLCLTPDSSAFINEDTSLRNIESMQMQQVEKVRSRIDMATAKDRVSSIETPIFVMGRNSDELQGIFRLTFELLSEASKDTIWKSYEHNIHGFIYPSKDSKGNYIVDEVQHIAIDDMIDFLRKYIT